MSGPASRLLSGSPRLHYLEWNPTAARALILLHGNCANAWWWKPTVQALTGHEIRVLALDLRGHGDSEWVKPPRYSPADYADDLARFITATGSQGAIVAGHSMGGIAVLEFLSRYDALVRAAVAIDIAVTSTPTRNRYLRRLKAIPTIYYPDLATAKARFRLMPNEGVIAPALLEEIAEHSIQLTTNGSYTMKFDRQSFFGSDGVDVISAIAHVRVPLLLVRAEHSRIMTASAAELARGLNPKVELVTVANSHHHLPLEAPRALARELERFAAAHFVNSH